MLSPDFPRPSPKDVDYAGRVLLRNAAWTLGVESNIERGINEIKKDPKEYKARIREFHEACGVFNSLITSQDFPTDGYYRATWFRNTVDEKPFPSPVDILARKDPSALLLAEDAYFEVASKIQTKEWEFPSKIENPDQLTTGLLIEGYGLFLEKLYGEPGLARNFVLGFEEVLWNEFPGSRLLKDALPWMIEDKKEFSWKVQRGLDGVDPEEILRRKKNDILIKAPFLAVFIDKKITGMFGGMALKAGAGPLQEELKERFGDNWEETIMSGPVATSEAFHLIRDDTALDVRGGILESLVLIGYEVGNESDLLLFVDGIVHRVYEALNTDELKDKDINVPTILFSIIKTGIDLRKSVDMAKSEEADLANKKAAEELPQVIRKYLEDMGFNF